MGDTECADEETAASDPSSQLDVAGTLLQIRFRGFRDPAAKMGPASFAAAVPVPLLTTVAVALDEAPDDDEAGKEATARLHPTSE